MPKRTLKFQQFPWIGGRNSSLDASLLASNQLAVADNTLLDVDGGKKIRNGFTQHSNIGREDELDVDFILDSSVLSDGNLENVVHLAEYWANVSASKVQHLVTVNGGGDIYQITADGTATPLQPKAGATGLSVPIENASFCVLAETLVMAFKGASTPKKWDKQNETEWEDLAGAPPNFSFCSVHQGRLWAAGDANNPDRLYYTSPGNIEEWQGEGDSGALDIVPGDGDSEGITAIFPTIKGQLFVAKAEKLYRVTGNTPETYRVELVSDGIGCVGQNAFAAIDQDDVMFVSKKGVHSLAATEKFGDFESTFVSFDIQREFDTFNQARLKFSQMEYLSDINSIVIAFAEESSSSNQDLHLYNIAQKAWSRWPSLNVNSILVALYANKRALFAADNEGRLLRLTENLYDDRGSSIPFEIETGIIYPDNDRLSVKGYKKVSIFAKPVGNAGITVKFQVDAQTVQSYTVSEPVTFDALGTAFTLGTSTLGLPTRLPPLTVPVTGYGRGFSINISHNVATERAEIFGFSVEYEPAGDGQKVLTT